MSGSGICWAICKSAPHAASKYHVKYDSVEKRWSYRLFNMAAYRFFLARSSWNCCIIFKTGYQVAKDGCILSKRKQKLIACITLTTCFQISSKTAIVCCPPDSSSSRTARQHTQRAVGQLSRFHHNWLIEQGLTSHQTHYRSYRGRVFTGQMTQPTVSKHWRKIGPKD